MDFIMLFRAKMCNFHNFCWLHLKNHLRYKIKVHFGRLKKISNLQGSRTANIPAAQPLCFFFEWWKVNAAKLFVSSTLFIII